jgi:NADPH-dependent 2,4-dienoyl-CoA reductase/sulfur reductase-like enzyme
VRPWAIAYPEPRHVAPIDELEFAQFVARVKRRDETKAKVATMRDAEIQDVTIVGAGEAGARLALELRAQGFAGSRNPS